MTTKGDANQTVDSVHLQPSQVIGLGRLLVRWVGLPLIWIQQGKWLNLGFFLMSLWIGVLLVMRDTDDAPPSDDAAEAVDDPDAEAGGLDGLEPSYTKALEPPPASALTFPAVAAAHPGPPRHHRQRRGLGTVDPHHECGVRGDYQEHHQHVVGAQLQLHDRDEQPRPVLVLETRRGRGRRDRRRQLWQRAHRRLHARRGPSRLWVRWSTRLRTCGVTATNAAAPGNNLSCIYTRLAPACATPGPAVYSEIIWFKTTTTTGGKLIG